jgi:hypothetical protein
MSWDRVGHINRTYGLVNQDHYRCRIQRDYIEQQRGAVLVKKQQGRMTLNCPRCMWTQVLQLDALDWNGDTAAPTINGTINCERPMGCGWSGTLIDGLFTRYQRRRLEELCS